MSKNRSRNSLLSNQPKTSHSVSTQDELSSMKYSLEKPNERLIYPLDSNPKDEIDKLKQRRGHPLTYPDFYPWKDPSQLDEDAKKEEQRKMSNSLYLNKGLFEAPQVPNEYYTARNLIQATLFSSGDNCMEVLKELSQHLASVYKTRNEVINKIKFESNNFKLPTRVTLTSSKREAWLKDLADSSVPLSNISARIPHGIKNKILVDILVSKKVPITRGIWFTKSVLYGDSVAIRKKLVLKMGQYQVNESTVADTYEIQWLQEWTQQVIDYIYRFSREFMGISSSEKKHDSMNKLNYLLKYIQTLYIECLLDKSLFVSSIVRFFKDGLSLDSHNVIQLILSSKSDANEEDYSQAIQESDMNYGQRLTGLLLLKVFWNDIIKNDYVCKDLSEALLLNYYFIHRIPVFNPKQLKFQTNNIEQLLSSKLKESLLSQIADSIKYLFKFNTNVFIIPSYWILICGTLFDIVLSDSNAMAKEELEDVRKQLKLISHRNESLMLAMKQTKVTKEEPVNPPFVNSHRRTSSLQAMFTPSNQAFEELVSPSQQQQSSELDTLESELFINRSPDDVLRIIDYLDKLKFNDELAKLLRPSFKKQTPFDWRLNLSVGILWCISKYKDAGESSENILMFCGFVKNKVMVINNPKLLTKFKNSMENSILDIIYKVLEEETSSIDLTSLYVLINELYQLKIISMSAYLRKLIASGIFNVEPQEQETFGGIMAENHLCMLQNLPLLNNKQCDNILKKWNRNCDFSTKFEHLKSILQEGIVNNVANNGSLTDDLSFLEDQEVGVKYLLINWLTGELKSLINNSSRLIHIRLLTVTLLYRLYAKCDNLAVFFKVVIKSILRNDGKVIIIDMDSLYLVSKLMIRHFKLIKTISANDSGSVGYETFKLIMLNYKDLTTREPDYFNFKSIWNFIDSSFERNILNENNNHQKIQEPATIPSYIYSKATMDSPMKLNTQTISEGKAEDVYSIDDFSNQLNDLLNQDYEFMNKGDVSSAMQTLKMTEPIEGLGDNGNRKLMVSLFDFYMKVGNNLTVDEDNTLIRLLINTRNSLQKENPFAFVECFSYFIQKQFENTENDKGRQKFIILLKKLICNDILDMFLVVHSISSMFNNQDSKESYGNLLYEIVIGDELDEQQTLNCNQILLLELNRTPFHSKFSKKTFDIISNELKATSLDILQKDNIMFYNGRTSSLLHYWIFSRSRFFIDQVGDHFNNDEIIQMINIVSGTNIQTIDELISHSCSLNEFNLAYFQVLSRLIVIKELTHVPDEQRYTRSKALIDQMIPKLTFGFSLENSFFGEFFNLFPWTVKSDILNILCTVLFSNTEFTDSSVTCQFQSIDILPLLSDFFKKFSISSIEAIEVTGPLFDDISLYLQNTLNLVDLNNDSCNQLHTALSIFIRVLIIHKESISRFILSNDSGYHFLSNLKKLYMSKFMDNTNNERLKILLYDLLLIFRNLITKEISVEEKKNAKISNSTPRIGDKPGDFTINEDIVDFQVRKYEKLAPFFDIPEIDSHNILQKYLDDTRIASAVMLDLTELNHGGDVQMINESDLQLVKPSRDSFLGTASFSILGERKQMDVSTMFKIKSYEILENTDKGINNGRISLSLFDAYTTKQNPP